MFKVLMGESVCSTKDSILRYENGEEMKEEGRQVLYLKFSGGLFYCFRVLQLTTLRHSNN
jgi:hypothetical protein